VEEFQRGKIVWAIIPDKQGRTKPDPRPAIVLATAHVGPDDEIPVVCCSTTFNEPLPADQILIHKDFQEDRNTKLRKPTVVVCGWIHALKVSAITERGGFLSGKRLLPIANKISELKRATEPPPASE